jgi:hypothetical protein
MVVCAPVTSPLPRRVWGREKRGGRRQSHVSAAAGEEAEARMV